MRICRVVVRKVVGTSWLPERVNQRAVPLSLSGIFQNSGIALDFVPVEPDLENLAGGRAFEPVDLHAALTATFELIGYRQPERAETGWTACVLIVPEISMRHGSRYRRPLGLMFDTGASDTDGRPREGCAIAYRRVGTDPRAYLRTVAHELGHVFNLGHPGEGLEPFGQDSFNTLMVPTESLNPARAEFRFTESQRDWLANGPEDYVRPGGQEYGTRPADWRPGGNGIAAPAGVPLDNGPGWS